MTNYEKMKMSIAGTWKERHLHTIEDVLSYINTRSERYILKGGTALMECYGLDRFSEDIDLNSTDHESILSIMKLYAKERGYSINLKKNTPVVKRFMIDYGNYDEQGRSKPLKVEISYREKYIAKEYIEIRNGIRVYDIGSLAVMKASAYGQRDKLRDLYDVTFIVNNYWNTLDLRTRTTITGLVSRKGIEQFDYLVATQKDELIDEDVLSEKFLEMFDIIGASNEPDIQEIPEPIIKQDKINEQEQKEAERSRPLTGGYKRRSMKEWKEVAAERRRRREQGLSQSEPQKENDRDLSI